VIYYIKSMSLGDAFTIVAEEAMAEPIEEPAPADTAIVEMVEDHTGHGH
jgi:hypothetical protein